VCGERQGQYLRSRQDESDLVHHRGEWYLLVTCDLPDPELQDGDNVLGVDVGLITIASDSDGTIHQGKGVTTVRYRHRRLRTKLQKKGTKATKRCLRQLAGQERRFAKDINYTISKRLVETAQRTKYAIALEDLTGIRTRVRVRKPQRARQQSSSFYQLRSFISYKAQRAGVRVVLVDPRNTSRTCPACGYLAKEKRPSQSRFCCVSCG
jgi:putative transposase